MKKALLGLIAIVLFSNVYAQENPTEEIAEKICDIYTTIQGPIDIQSATEQTYEASVEKSEGESIQSEKRSKNSTFTITQNEKIIKKFRGVSSFSYRFEKDGAYTISHNTTHNGCTVETKATITAYKYNITYIGEQRTDLTTNIINNLKQRSIFLRATERTQKDKIITDTNYDSELIIVNSSNKTPIQQIINQITQKAPEESTIVIISDADDDLNRKIFGSLTRDVKQEIHIINNQAMRELILFRRTGEREEGEKTIKKSLNLNNTQDKGFGFNKIIDILLYQGIPLPIIANMFILTIVALILIFLRQVVGMEVFTIYYPILGAITLLLVGYKIFAISLFIARCAHLVTHILARKLNILVHAKIGIYITFYMIFAIIALRGATKLIPSIDRGYIPQIGTRGVMSGLFSTLIIGQRIFSHKEKRYKQIMSFITYAIIVIPITYLLTSINIQYRVITHTRVAFFIVILAIILGRFTGMKLLEYKRFWRLIWKQMKERS